jgi:hypoxanthine phosphoribosyltransferase
MAAEPEPKHYRVTYNQVHNLIKRTAKEIAEFKPDVLLAIGKKSNL